MKGELENRCKYMERAITCNETRYSNWTFTYNIGYVTFQGEGKLTDIFNINSVRKRIKF